MATIKITELTSIGANLTSSTVIPVVNMSGTPTTEKTLLGNIANVVLTGAGNTYSPAGRAILAQTVTNAAQPNITSVGTLTGLSISGNLTAANITANTGVFTGNGSGLSAIAGGNVTGQVANALVTGTVYTAAQPNITSVGTLTNLAISGNASVNGNITSNGTAFVGNISTTGLASITTLNVGATANLGAVGNVKITGGTDGYVLQTDGTGNLSWTAQTGGGGNGTVGGANTQVQFNDAGSFGGNAGFTFNKTTGVFASPFLAGNGNGLSNIQGANISGFVPNANVANTAFAVAGANVSGTVGNANLAQYLNVTDVNNNFSYHVALSAGSGDKSLHIDADDNLQYNPADGILTVNRVDTDFLEVQNSVITNLIPFDSLGLSLGNATNPWQDLYLSNSTLYLGDATITANGNSIVVDSITINNGNVGTIGNIASINLTGSNSNVLYGNGVFAPVPGAGGLPLANGSSNFNIATSGGNATIDVAGLETWTFDTNGNLTIPGSIVGTATIGIDNRATGNSADIELYSADDITIQARDRATGSNSEGGDINIYAGDSAEDSDSSGGDVVIEAGNGGAANVDYGGSGGFIRIEAGRGGAASTEANGFSALSGGQLTLNAGDGGTNNGNVSRGASGGDVSINAGDSTGSGQTGGDIFLTTGLGGGNALAGRVQIITPSSATANGGTWTFDGNGNLTLPANTFAVNYANGSQVPIGGGSGFTTPYTVATFVANTQPGFGEIQFANFEGANSLPDTAQKLFINEASDNEQSMGTIFQQWTSNSYRGTLSLNNGGDSQATFNISNGRTYFEPETYRGFKAGLNQIWGDDCSINQLIITNASAPNFYNTEFLVENDVFNASGLATGNTHIMLNVYGSSQYNPINPENLWYMFTSFVNNVLYDGSTLRTDVDSMKTQFYNNAGNFRGEIPTADLFQYFIFTNSNGADYFGTAPTTASEGTGATVRIRVNPNNTYTVLGIANPGIGYVDGDNLFVAGTNLGGASPANDLTLLIDSVDLEGRVTAVSFLSGTGAYPWPSNRINDGGDDQYDTGNYLNTNLASQISYANGITQTDSAAFGGGDYCVMYDQSFFCMIATGVSSSVSNLFYSGNLGFDGDGFLNWTGLRSPQNVVANNNARYAYFDCEYLDGELTPSVGLRYNMTLDSAGINLDGFYAYYDNNVNDYFFGSNNSWRVESQDNLYVQSYNEMFIQTRVNQNGIGEAGPTLNIDAGDGSPGQREINAQAGTGGSLNIRGGDAGENDGITSLGNTGGTVYIQGGRSTGPNQAGGVHLTGGSAGSATGSAGDINLYTTDGNGDGDHGKVRIHTYDGGNNRQWTFYASGNFELPENGKIVNNVGSDLTVITDNNGIINSSLEMSPNNTLTRVEQWSSQQAETFNNSDWDTGTYTVEAGQGAVQFTDATNIINFINSLNGVGQIYFSVNGGSQLVWDGTSSGDGAITFYTPTLPENDPTPVTSFTYYYSYKSGFEVDYDSDEVNIYANQADIKLETTGQRDIGLNAGGVVTIAANSNSASTWTFDASGNLILAGGGSIVRSVANSSLDPINPNVSTMIFTPDSGYSSQSLVLDPTAPGHIHLRAPGANIDNPDANIFLGGETSSFEVGYGPTPNLFIHSGGNTWEFLNDGNLVFPRDDANGDPFLRITGGTNPRILSEDASLAGPANLEITALYTKFTGSSGEAITIYPDDGEISGDVNVQIWTNAASNTQYSWTFGDDGTLTVPFEGAIRSNDDTIILQSYDTPNSISRNMRLGTNGGLFLEQTGLIPTNNRTWLTINPNAGNPEIFASVGVVGNAAGGNISIAGGAADQSTFNTSAGGNVNITGGLGASDDGGGGGPGGSVNISAGLSADPVGNAGNVVINTGGTSYTFNELSLNVSTNPPASPAPTLSGFGLISAPEFTNGNSNVTINANSNTWIFDSTGNLTTPSNLVIGPTGFGAGTGFTQSNSPLLLGSSEANGRASLIWYENPTGPGNVVQVGLNDSTPGSMTVLTGNFAGTTYVWDFDNTGNLTLPTGGNIYYANGTIYGGGGGGSYGDSNVATFLASYGSNTISTTGNISAGNVITTANIRTGGQIQSTAFTGANISWVANGTTSFEGNIRLGGTGRILSPGGAASIETNNSGANIPQLRVTSATAAANTTSGSLIVSGGSGIAGNVYIGGLASVTGNITGGNISATGTVTATGKIGYASGSTVTQTTNRGNSVTINALAGTIITTSASMVAGQLDTFGVSNNQVDPNNDIVLVQVVSPNFGMYNVVAQPSSVISSFNNGFFLTIQNISGGPSSNEAITIRFMVIKAPNA